MCQQVGDKFTMQQQEVRLHPLARTPRSGQSSSGHRVSKGSWDSRGEASCESLRKLVYQACATRFGNWERLGGVSEGLGAPFSSLFFISWFFWGVPRPAQSSAAIPSCVI